MPISCEAKQPGLYLSNFFINCSEPEVNFDINAKALAKIIENGGHLVLDPVSGGG